MKLAKTSWFLACLAFPMGISAVVLTGQQPAAPCFRDIHELQDWAHRHGLYSGSDRRDGKVFHGVAVSTRPLSWLMVGGLRKAPAPDWDGVIWAANRGRTLDDQPASPWEGECRVWGQILVTGDPRLLDRIEQGLPPESE
jgi:hypothetical protein